MGFEGQGTCKHVSLQSYPALHRRLCSRFQPRRRLLPLVRPSIDRAQRSSKPTCRMMYIALVYLQVDIQAGDALILKAGVAHVWAPIMHTKANPCQHRPILTG